MTGYDMFDNRTKILKDDLVARLRAGDRVSIAAAFFSLYGYQELKGQLNACDEVRFLFTEPTFTKAEESKERREFYIPRRSRERGVAGTDLEIRLRNKMTQQALAQECADWIRRKARFCSLSQGVGAMQSFLEVESPAEHDSYVYTPIEGLTTTTLGTTPGSSRFTNIFRNPAPMSTQLLQLFDEAWEDPAASEDVTDRVIESVESMYRENAPELIYYSALNDIFREFLDDLSEDDLPKEATGFKASKIWGMCYDFQRDAALAIISKLETYNGCILADSVGLGKTFTALAVIKYYESRNRNVLVLCPKKLADNWLTYRSNYKNNPVYEDRLRYDVLYHTDLSRTHGSSGTISDLSRLNWDTYDLVVIDESHNFRNGGDNASKNDDRENRYQKLINHVIKEGVRTRVLMLSATPVNNRFRDLQNQLELAYCRSDRDWQQLIGLRNTVPTIFRQAQGAYKAWTNLPADERTTQHLMEHLDPDFFKLLDHVTVARSRKQIQRYYDVEALGPFPKRLPPITRQPELSTSPDVASFKDIADALNALMLASYVPSAYIQPSKRAKYQQAGLTSEGREMGLRKLMAINLLKRLESSVNSFRMTVDKIALAVQQKVDLVNAYEASPSKVHGTVVTDQVPDLDLDDEESSDFMVGNDEDIRLEDMDWVRWRDHMRKDLQTFRRIKLMVAAADPEHDAKLLELEDLIEQKLIKPVNPGNRKVLVFTAFADTADYLYQNVAPFAQRLGLQTAVVTGTGAARSTIKSLPTDTQSVLTCFSPVSKERAKVAPQLAGKDIDILIATDCISEGQNLQDCDCVVNYDIHWNPVRIVQRFGRVDRIGSHNNQIQLVNFWPNVELDEYIQLRSRVEARMRITVLTSTGDDDPVNLDEQGDLEYRRNQLEQMKREVVDLEDVSGGVSITDLGLDEFRTDLLAWNKLHPEGWEPPHGIHAVVQGDQPGIIFVLRNVNPGVNISKANRLHPFYLVYVGEDGTILEDQLQVHETLSRMRALCRGKGEHNKELCRQFNRATKNGKDMRKPSRLLDAAVDSIVATDQQSLVQSFFGGGLTGLGSQTKGLDDFELLYFLVVV